MEQGQALDFNSSGFEAGELRLGLYAPDMGEDDAGGDTGTDHVFGR